MILTHEPKKRYPHKPAGIEVFWDNGKYVAIITGENGQRFNAADYNAQTKRDAINGAREHLGMARIES